MGIWEDLSARMQVTGSQSGYNEFVKNADMFVLLAYTKVGMYTAEEFDKTFGQFVSIKKPSIFTYFKNNPNEPEASLNEFKQKLSNLGHFYSPFVDSNDLWNQFNKELERLEANGFTENKQTQHLGRIINQGDKSVYVEKAEAITFKICGF